MPSPSFESLAASGAEIRAPGDPAYDAVREGVTWNKRLDKARTPELIVTARSAAQVAAAIRFAAANGMQVSPRGSGHHYEAAALPWERAAFVRARTNSAIARSTGSGAPR